MSKKKIIAIISAVTVAAFIGSLIGAAAYYKKWYA